MIKLLKPGVKRTKEKTIKTKTEQVDRNVFNTKSVMNYSCSLAYIKRVIAHPSFQNVDFKTAEKMLLEMDQGDVVIRPSSKGLWKVNILLYG